MLDIRLMGPPMVEVGQQPLVVDTRKAIALLAYLAVERNSSRDVLSTLLWGDSSTERARATLRRTLSSLRNGVGDKAVEADRNRLALSDGANIDVDDFEAEIAATRTHDHHPGDVCAACIPHLARATALYRGDFMEGFSVRDAPEFEDWARGVTESLRLQASECFNRLALARAAAGDYTGAISAVQGWIDLDELHEPAHRLLMLLKAWSGDRPGAVSAYREFVGIADRELGVAPLEETTELYEAILDEDLPPAPAVRRGIKALSPAPAGEDDLLIDRALEMALLRSAWFDTPNAGKILTIRGAVWMGKTRLIEEFARERAVEGATVLIGRAFRSEQGLPYGVVTQILRSASGLIDELSSDMPEWAVREVARLLPGGRQAPSDDPADRFAELRLLEGLYEAFAAATRRGPIVLLVDDGQWIDPASAGLLSYLASRARQLPLMMVVTVRSGETPPEPLVELTRAGDTITLEPLTADDLIGFGVDAGDAGALVGGTGGVPLLVREMIEGERHETPASVSRYLELRSHDLSDLARQVLSAAAVIDGMGDVTLLREVSGRSEVEVVDAVEELLASGLLRELPEGAGLGLQVDSQQRSTYDGMSLVRRRLLHRRAAEALATRPRATMDLRLAASVAAQFRGAGDTRAGDWYQLAGGLARAVYANEEARVFYEAAEALGASDPAHVRLALAELAMTRGDYQTALQELTIADSMSEDEDLGRVEHRLGELHRLLGRFEIADEHYARAVAAHPQPATVYADWAMLHHRVGDRESAKAAASESLRFAGKDGDERLLSRAENVAGVVASDPALALAHFDRALALAGIDDLARMAALNNKAHALASCGDVETAYPLVEQAIKIAASTGHRHREAALRNHLADLHHRSGRTNEAREESMRAVSLFAGIDAGSWEPEVWLLSSW